MDSQFAGDDEETQASLVSPGDVLGLPAVLDLDKNEENARALSDTDRPASLGRSTRRRLRGVAKSTSMPDSMNAGLSKLSTDLEVYL